MAKDDAFTDDQKHCLKKSFSSYRQNTSSIADTTQLSMSTTSYDRASEIKAFDETKAGVKGLVDAGITEVPRFFIHPTETIISDSTTELQIPVIDMKDVNTRKKEIVEKVKEASETIGFFKVANHGVPNKVMDEMLDAIKRFMDDDDEGEKKKYYSRDNDRKVMFNCNYDLYSSPAANWRDTLIFRMAPDPPEKEEVPCAFREIVFDYSFHMKKLGEVLLELLSEALGLKPDHLKEMECAHGIVAACHYYPPCPEPHLAIGTSKHSDPGFFTILLQDKSISGLQMLHNNKWVDVPPSPGCLVINIADLLQLISNDKLKTVEHRVLASKEGPRLSVACLFLNQYSPSRVYGPIMELLANGSAPIYREVVIDEFNKHYNTKRPDGMSALDHFKL
ncbi:1-aminocyclopropane-1-carboxylate oxidase homolog 1-like [Dioscorea cayenensis subsp. rotundata]|uniref:1-aminocyclopropane-1-carboxylate oxidase homolog 1-like n=1 Tax=Dioscorea cayennensis subsp. rotundata TaxID=55577 RepID=A0AB40AZ95_DIOCR|nr:1-aminocyclopropane-1-carboxylate oxidase homolog 1-like [Dioscorea cayenensis subsp. rotundata]